MKEFLTILFASLVLHGAAWGQGRVNFANSPSTLITTNGTSLGLGAGPTVATAGRYYFGLYVGSIGTPESQLTLALLATNVASPGRLSGGNPVALPAQYPAGIPLTFQVRAWSSFAGQSYDEALLYLFLFLQQGGLPRPYGGSSALGQVTPTASPNPAAVLFGTGPGQIGGFELFPPLSPEPSAMALAALGTLALALANRKRRR